MESHENILKRTISWIYDIGYDFVRIENAEYKHRDEFQEKKSQLLNATDGPSVCSEIVLMRANFTKNIAFILSENLDQEKIKRGIYGKGVFLPSNLKYDKSKSINEKNGTAEERKLIICYVFIEEIKKVLFNSEDTDPKYGSDHGLAIVEFEEEYFSSYPIHIVHIMPKHQLQSSYSAISNPVLPIDVQDTNQNCSSEVVTKDGFSFDDFKIEKKLVSQIARCIGIDSFRLVMFFLAVYLGLLPTFSTLLTSTVLSFMNIFVLRLFEEDVSLKHRFTGKIVPIFFNEYCVNIFEKIWNHFISSGLHTYTIIVLLWFIFSFFCNFANFCVLIILLVILRLSAVCVGRKRRMPVVNKKKNNKVKKY